MRVGDYLVPTINCKETWPHYAKPGRVIRVTPVSFSLTKENPMWPKAAMGVNWIKVDVKDYLKLCGVLK